MIPARTMPKAWKGQTGTGILGYRTFGDHKALEASFLMWSLQPNFNNKGPNLTCDERDVLSLGSRTPEPRNSHNS